jgi:hypothetical protein
VSPVDADAPGRPTTTRQRFVAALGDALGERRGWAAGKLGGTERSLLRYPIVRERESDPRRLRVFETALAQVALRHGGVFPAGPAFLATFSRAYADSVARLDWIGVDPALGGMNDELFRFHRFPGEVMDFVDQEPDRSIPNDDGRCYLPLLRGRRLLLVCPFAELLRERAQRETFEAVWRRTGKRWFEPAAVEAVELPYGFARATQRRYATALDLLAEARSRVEVRDFDVALLAAGPLGVMLAAGIKAQGRVAISLGGHLQVLFGVIGRRWRELPEWRRDYFTEAWIDMPVRYRPDPAETDADYW